MKESKKRHVIVVSPSTPITIPQYIAAVQKAKAFPDAKFSRGLNQWWPCTGSEIYAQYIDSMHDRINSGIKNRNL